MKLSQSTIQTLSSLSNICPQIFIRAGKELRSIDRQEGTQIMAIAKIEDEFPIDFGIYDLKSLLGILKMFEEPEINFGDKYMTISSGSTHVRYLYTSPNLVPKADSRTPKLADTRIEFKLTADALSRTMTAAAHMRLPDITVRSRNGFIELVARDKDRTKNNATDEDSNEFVTVLDEYSGPDFVADYLASNIGKLIDADYDVIIGYRRKESAVLYLQNEQIEFLMTSEATSSYEGDL